MAPMSRAELILALSLTAAVLGASCGIACAQQASAPGCIGEGGSQVDFWAILKVPQSGRYAYVDSKSFGGSSAATAEWKTLSQSDLSNGGQTNALSSTLVQLYENHAELSYAMYNDEVSKGTKPGFEGMAKGVWATGPGGGFLITHTLPNWPPPASGGQFKGIPKELLEYGQSLMCVSMDLENMDYVAKTFVYSGVKLYDSNVNDSLQKLLPKFSKYMASTSPFQGNTHTMVDVQTRSGKFTFILYARTTDFDVNLYSEISNSFRVPFLADTSTEGAQAKSYCPKNGDDHPYSIMTVQHLAVADEAFGSIDWLAKNDNSKWLVEYVDHGKKPKESVVCLGDLDGITAQKMERGGGAICIANEALWTAFFRATLEYEKCETAAARDRYPG